MRSDDRGSLPLAMLLTLVGVMLSAVLTPVVVTQVQATRNQIQRVHALGAAQTGIDIALGQIRNANDGAGNGVRANLPCGPFAGNVGAGGTARYQVTIDYLNVDYKGQIDLSRDDTPANPIAVWIGSHRLPCVAGSGTGPVPVLALLRALGTDRGTGAFNVVPIRSLWATYTFRTTAGNIPGGLLHVYRTATSQDLCLDAGSATPPAATNVTMQACAIAASRQTFAYNANLTLVLTSSKTPTQPLGMCLDAGTVPHAAGRVVQFQPCGVTTSPQQQWTLNDMANLEGTADGTTLDGFCFNVQTRDTTGSFLVLGSVAAGTCRAAYGNTQTFAPESTMGAGAAGAATGQLVDLDQVGRCLNVTQQTVGYPYLTGWACQQTTNPATVAWSQKWTVPVVAAGASSGTGRISTTNGTAYCLRSPGSTATGQYPTLVACPGGPGTPLNLTWTRYTETGRYGTSYQIVDGFGFCLQPTDPAAQPADLHPGTQQFSKIKVATCDGSTRQKWNAPPGATRALPLTDIGER